MLSVSLPCPNWDQALEHLGVLSIETLLTRAAEGEFHVDLYTLPDNLIKMLWDFTTEKVQISAAG